MNLAKICKKHVFKFLAVLCIILLIFNGTFKNKTSDKNKKRDKRKVKEGLVTCKNTCSDLTKDRIDFSNLQTNINRIMELFSRLKGHCKNRCVNDHSSPVASNDETTDSETAGLISIGSS